MSQDKAKRKRPNFLINALRMMFMGSNHVKYTSSLEEEQMRSPVRTMVANFFEKKLAVTGLVSILVIMVSCYVLAAIYPLDIYRQDVTQQNVGPGFHLMSVPKALTNDLNSIAVGSTFGIGVDNAGKVYAWGHLPSKLKTIPKEAKDVVMVAAGSDHAHALTKEGDIITWGNTRFKQNQIPQELLNADGVKQLIAGDQFSVALTTEGSLYFWGNGNLISMTPNSIPKDVQGKIEKISVNSDNILLLLDDGSLRVLGIKATPMYNVPAEVQGHAVDVATAKDASVALTEDGRVYAWGNDRYGLLAVPEEVQGHAKRVVAGRAHFVVITDDGKAIAWGDNANGQLNIPREMRPGGSVVIDEIYVDYYQNYVIDSKGELHSWGLRGYLLGSDGYGRDIFRRLVAGGRMTLSVGAVAVLISLFIGIIVGGLAGFYGGKVDNLLMRFAEIMGAIPFLPFAMTLSVVLANNVSETGRILVIMGILGILSWPGLARLVRGQILAEREKEFVTAAKALGIRELKIIFRHILPNVISVIIVNVTLSYASSLLTESSLSFLGFGVVEPSPTWGNMLFGAQNSSIIANYWWRWVFPSLALGLSTISINLLGDGLRDAIDPKSNER